MAEGTWHFEWLTQWDEVWDTTFVAQWRQWMRQSAGSHVFFEPAIVRAWVETYQVLRRISPRFLVGRRGDSTLFLPLVLDRGGWKESWITSIQPVGANEFDYHDPIIHGQPLTDEEDIWPLLLEVLQKEFPRVDRIILPRLRSVCRQSPILRPINEAPFLDLTTFASPEDVLPRLSESMRQDLRRQMRRLKERGELKLEICGSNEVQKALSVVPRFLEAHKARWPRAFRARGFVRRLVENGVPDGVVNVSVLRNAGQELSWHISLRQAERFYYYLAAFDETMTQFSPGKVHLLLMIQHAMSDGVKVFDFLTGKEAYKLRWTSQSAPLFSLDWSAKSAQSRLKQAWHRRVWPAAVKLKGGLAELVRNGTRGKRA